MHIKRPNIFGITNSKAQAITLREDREGKECLKFLSYTWHFWLKKKSMFYPPSILLEPSHRRILSTYLSEHSQPTVQATQIALSSVPLAKFNTVAFLFLSAKANSNQGCYALVLFNLFLIIA